jgi:hypothetical protein
MKALRILLVAAMAMMMVSGAFAQDYEFSMGGRADYSLEFTNEEVGDADAVTTIETSDGGRVQFKGNVSKELANGATAALVGVLHLERDGASVDDTKVKYISGPLTVTMIKASRESFMDKGPDFYVPQDPLYCGEMVDEKGISFEYAGEGMTFMTTVNYEGDNRIGVHPYVEMGMGAATIKAAVEYVTEFPQDTDADGPTVSNFGGGVGLYTEMGALSLGVSGGYAVLGGKDDAGEDLDSTNQMSVYAYAKMSVGAGTLGLAGGYDMESIDEVDDDYTGYQVNASYEQGDIVVPGLKLSIGGGYAFNEDHDTVETTKTGGKVRLRYEF